MWINEGGALAKREVMWPGKPPRRGHWHRTAQRRCGRHLPLAVAIDGKFVTMTDRQAGATE